MNRRRSASLITAVVLALIFLVGLIWANLFYSGLDPAQGSFLPRWLGTRLFLTTGQSPYSPETTAEIQKAQAASRVAAQPGASAFLYPFYTFLVYSPFALTADQTAARVAWMTMLEVALFAVLAISLSLSRWRFPGWALVLLIPALLTWYYALRPVLDGDLSIVVALLIVGAVAALRAEQDPLAGLLLALAMMKPVAVLPLVVFILIWTGAQRRWVALWSFLGSLGLIVAATSLLIPDWVVQDIRQIIEYLRLPLTNTPGTLIAHWLPGIGRQIGWLITILSLILLAVEWSQAMRKEFRWFYWTACLTLAVTPLIGLPNPLNNFVIIYPAVILALATWEERWGNWGRALVLGSLLLLGIVPWWLASAGLRSGMPPEQNPWLYLFLPFFMIASLYWVRWWAVRPPRLPVPDLAANLGR